MLKNRELNLNLTLQNIENFFKTRSHSSCIFKSWFVFFCIGLLLLSSVDCSVTNEEDDLPENAPATVNERPCNFLLDFEDAQHSTPEIIEKYGYPVERHWITTEDGYILGVHRIPQSTGSKTNSKILEPKNLFPTHDSIGSSEIKSKPAILLMHGIFGSSRQFVINCDRRAMAFQLWENGYDVWMGNYRGNNYSRNHTSLDPEASEFWDFWVDHVGYFDIPATVDYILRTTSLEKLSVLGHSMGNGVILGMLANRPEYNDKVNIWFDIAGSLTMEHIHSSIIKLIARFKGPLHWVFNRVSHGELDGTKFLNQYLPRICRRDGGSNAAFRSICTIVSTVATRDSHQIPADMHSVILGGLPSATSVKLFIQSLQLIHPGSLMFDLEPAINLSRSKDKSYQPRPYLVENVRVPTVVLFGERDNIVTVKDILETKQILDKSLKDPSIVEFFKIDSPTWNHLDFMFGKDADILVYPHILKKLKMINQNNSVLTHGEN